jgi:uncharacterized protein (TIGR03382 family)
MRRPLQRGLALLIVAAVAAQFFLAAAGAFGAIDYSAHKTVGYTLAAAVLVAVLVALLARRHLLPSLLLVVALAVQVALGSLGTSSSSWFGAFHGLNALFVMATAGNLARRAAAGPGVSRAA